MELKDLSCSEFTGQLAAKTPVPGGGGACALAGAVGAALGVMVGNLTVGKKKYEANEAALRKLMEQAESLRLRLLACIDEDAEAFEPLSRAYGIPKGTPGREETMEACLRAAAETPYKILCLCCETIDLHREFAEKGSVLAVSDAATGAALCRGALCSAAVNVKSNTAYMKDRAYADELNARVDEKLAAYCKAADEIFGGVYSKL